MSKLIAMLMLAAIAAPAEARSAKSFIGEWCLTASITSGYDTETKKYTPRDNYYSRAVADCPADKRVTFGPHSLDGLEYEPTPEAGGLIVYGWPKTEKGNSPRLRGRP